VTRGLRAVGAVFGATASFDVHKGTHLNGSWVMVAAVNVTLLRVRRRLSNLEYRRNYCCKGEVHQRSVVDFADFLLSPIIADSRVVNRSFEC
jgi:hypothetical protein